MKRFTSWLFLLLFIQLSPAKAQIIYGDNINGLSISQKGERGLFALESSNGKQEGDAVAYELNNASKSRTLTHMFVSKGIIKSYTIYYIDSSNRSTVTSYLVENGKQNGKGIFIDQTGLVYFGNLLNNGLDGIVHTLFANNKFALTTFKNNVPVAFDSASTTEGCSYGNCKEGLGRLFTKEGIFQGNFSNETMGDGSCIYRFQKNGSEIVKVGNMVNSGFSGYGLQKQGSSFYFIDFSKTFNSIYEYSPGSGVKDAQLLIKSTNKFRYDASKPNSLFLEPIRDKEKVPRGGIQVEMNKNQLVILDGEFDDDADFKNGVVFVSIANDSKLVINPSLLGNGKLSNMVKPIFNGFELTEKLVNTMANNKIALKVPLANNKSLWKATPPVSLSKVYNKEDYPLELAYNYYWKDASYFKTEDDSLLLMISIHDNLNNVKEAAQNYEIAKKNPSGSGAQSQMDLFTTKISQIQKYVTSGYQENATAEFMKDLTQTGVYKNSSVFEENGFKFEKPDDSVLIFQYNNYPINKVTFAKASPAFAKYNYAYLYAYLDKSGRACNAMILSKEAKITDEKGERTKSSATIMYNLINLIYLQK